MAQITISSKTSNSVTLLVSSLDTSWTDGTRTVYWYLGITNSNYYEHSKTSTIPDGVSSGGSVTFTGLYANTQYKILCEIYHGSTLLVSLVGYVTTSSSSGGGDSSNIVKWNWNVSNGDATTAETINAYMAIVQGLKVNQFSYRVWNDLVYKVKEILDSIGESWDNYYAYLGNTLMTENDRTLTATRFNSLRYNIGSRYSTGIQEVKKDDEVYGQYFRGLTQVINLWIDSLQ